MYNDNYGYKSGINNTIKADLEDVVSKVLQKKPEILSWLDIASNDGTLLSFVPETVYKVGIDPLRKFSEEALTHADKIIVDFFDAKYF
ncbi:MAG TPA: hypothetical protein VIY47_15505, partial [Ignavibacteriaceae bacterium]